MYWCTTEEYLFSSNSVCFLNPSKLLMRELLFHGFNTHRSTPQQNIVSIISISLKSPIDTVKPCYGLYTYSMQYTPSKTSCNNEQSVIRFCAQYRYCSVVLALSLFTKFNAILIVLALQVTVVYQERIHFRPHCLILMISVLQLFDVCVYVCDVCMCVYMCVHVWVCVYEYTHMFVDVSDFRMFWMTAHTQQGIVI